MTPASFSYAGPVGEVLAGGRHRSAASARQSGEALQQRRHHCPQSSDVLSWQVGGRRSQRSQADHGSRSPAAPRPMSWSLTGSPHEHETAATRRVIDGQILTAGHGPGRDQRCPDRTGQIRLALWSVSKGATFVFAQGYEEEVLACARRNRSPWCQV